MKRITLLLSILSLILSAQKLEITADKFIAKDADKKVSFIGNAKIAQGSTRVQAAEIFLYFNEDNSTKMYQAKGSVTFHIKKAKTNYRGSCSQMKYFPKTKTYLLTGGVHVKDKQNGREMTASRIEINAQTGAFSVSGNRKRAAKLVFDIQ